KRLIFSKKVKNIKRRDSIIYLLTAIKRYDDALIFFRQENVGRKDIAEAEKKDAEDFLNYFTEEEIAEAKKSVLKGDVIEDDIFDVDA
ncbi:MAG: hypothetical protein KAR23_05215, partial [Candidatus Aenigmarchaeota archaeon]|nr:hypothetical protein [Candidatus Aenigmarchaeota archaeon]